MMCQMRLDPKTRISNPVWYIRQQIESGILRGGLSNPIQFAKSCRQYIISTQNSGIELPKSPCLPGPIDFSGLRLGKSRVGSIGLVVAPNGDGFVTELKARKSSCWDVEVHLPFNEQHIIDALSKLFAGCRSDLFLPEMKPYSISGNLLDRSIGGSMDISCLLAIVASAEGNEHNELLNFACSIVEPAENGSLVESGQLKSKLAAFRREYGTGSLLICHPQTDLRVIEGDDCFETIWRVDSFASLAEKLEVSGLIEPLIQQQTLTMVTVDAVQRQIEYYQDQGEDRLGDGEELAGRAIKCIDDKTPLDVRMAITKLEEDLQRHQGNFPKAIENAERYLTDRQFEAAASYEDLITRDYRLAAAYYDAHQFEQIKKCLSRWISKSDSDPKIVSVATRIKLLNTYGRLLSATNSEDWERYFLKSLELHASTHVVEDTRTRNYLIKGYLQVGDTSRAQEHIAFAETQRESAGRDSGFHLDFYQADLSQQLGEIWKPPWLQNQDRFPSHAEAFCIQACARQAHTRDVSQQLLTVAADSLAKPTDTKANVKVFLSRCCRLAAAVYGDDSSAVEETYQSVVDYLNQKHGYGARLFYSVEINKLSVDPSLKNIQLLFRRIPHF